MAQNRHWEQNKDATVYIGNIDERATDAIIYELMLQAGPVVNVHLPKDRVTQTHQGYGFVEFNGEIDADYASKVMNGIRLYGKPLRVNMASADKQKAPEIGAELFIGNLDPMVDEKVLYDTFSRFGGLVSAPKIARDDNGASKGYGFVSYTDFDSSDDAIANMNGQYLMSKEVSVQYAYKKDGKGERHGDEAERKLAAQAKKHNIVPEVQALPPALVMANPPTPSTMGTPTAPAVQPPLPTGFDTPPNMVAVPPPSAGFGVPPGGPRFNAPPAVPVSGPPRPSAPLPAPPAGLPPRPPPSTGGYGGPAEFHPGGSFRPPPAVPTGFSGLPPNPSLPANPNLPAPPSFVAPPGGPGGGPGAPPSGFMPPPGFVAPPPGFRR